MTYDEAIRFLYELRLHGLKLGLENPRRLAALAGNPQDRLRFIHVAGTNGKGSTCAMLESIYRAAGLKVGLFTSPHLISFRERIQVDRRLVPAAEVVRGVERIRHLLGAFDPEHPPTFFEVVTVMALRYFADQECDLVVWETGMGGRLDATNIVTPLASVITNVHLDHEKWLGGTLACIAAEKAGIIKPHVPAITGADEPEALAVIRRIAREQPTSLIEMAADAGAVAEIASIALPLLGPHQQRNAALTLATVGRLQPVLPVTQDQVRRGLESVNWPGRLQRVQRRSGGEVLLDGAHNPAGVATLREVLQSEFAGRPVSLILGILQDKDWRHMCEALAPLARRILVVPVRSERTAAPMELLKVCRQANPTANLHAVATLGEALDATRDDPFVVVTGSLYLVGEALEALGLGPSDARDERRLNEWGGKP